MPSALPLCRHLFHNGFCGLFCCCLAWLVLNTLFPCKPSIIVWRLGAVRLLLVRDSPFFWFVRVCSWRPARRFPVPVCCAGLGLCARFPCHQVAGYLVVRGRTVYWRLFFCYAILFSIHHRWLRCTQTCAGLNASILGRAVPPATLE